MGATKTNTRQAEIDRLKALTGCEFTEREDGWLVYDGNVDLRGAEIQELEKTEVSGYIDLWGSSIESLKQVQVSEWLDLRYTPIKRLEQVEVGGALYLKDTLINRMELGQEED